MELFILIIIIIVVILVANSSSKKTNTYQKKNHKNLRRSNNSYHSTSSRKDASWIPKDKTVTIKGISISGGMIYVGRNLPTVTQENYRTNIEPALINPQEPVNRQNPDYDGNTLGYWPSYNWISSEARAAYLEWLASDRNDPDTPIGYIFLYYYGLERRILYDSQKSNSAKEEVPAIIDEIERLLSVYKLNRSFRRYATNLLQFVKFTSNAKKFFNSAVESENLNFSEYFGHYYDHSLNFKMGLASFAIKNIPIPAEWALKWAIPNSYSYLKTPAQRCKEEFFELFRKLYNNKYGDGILIKPNKATIKFSYRPASSSFGNQLTARTNLPDLTNLQAPVRKISELIETCTNLLDPYSRYLGRNPKAKRTSVDAISNLPKELLRERLNDSLIEFVELLNSKLNGNNYALLKTSHFTKYWDIEGVNKYKKNESIEIAQFLFKLGYGIEPDLRFGSAKFERDSQVVIFRLNPETFPKSPSKEYKLALTILHLTSVVGLADGKLTSEEEQYIDEYIEDLFQLTDKEKLRLNAYLYWLKEENPGITGLKGRIKNLKKEKRKSILQFLIKIANADGYISPEEVNVLQKVADIFEVDHDTVYNAIHLTQTSEEDPILIVKGDSSGGFNIPKEKKASEELDRSRINKTLKETDEVQSILTDIFTEEEIEEETVPSENRQQSGTILGLDKLHSKLIRELFSKEKWTKVEYESLCSEKGLFPDGALELINEKSFDEFDDLLLIESKNLELNMELVNKIK